jgi:hypothetical protein
MKTYLKMVEFLNHGYEANEVLITQNWYSFPFDMRPTMAQPISNSATLNIIPHLEFNIGAFFSYYMHDITQSLYKLSKELGVVHHFSQKVDEIPS